ncbi:MAG: DUF1573 domain-containing protein [Hymenobacteraceae bacterium]|nr:DUF1573 domain-containing protein [Hymenobacteraceae bacterium]MDX5395346.1 DUF1573 domain-containing protein [Hymenobacteraceae bacterium]MDX5511397.1 DUF1573 domain-containing protein [Hymenobacteraceae bacterium]
MKQNLVYVAAMALALVFTGCNEEKATEAETTTTNETLDEKMERLSAEEVINNPNTANQQDINAEAAIPVLSFEKPEHDFGTIKPGEVVKHTFTFKNTGKAPLVIESATASCGCTVPQWPREPIAPGETGKIEVQFDSKGKFGQQAKQVTIRANTQPNITTLTIKGNIPGSPDNSQGPVRAN